MSIESIVTVASWEPRFELGLERLLDDTSTNRVLMYNFDEYALRTEAVRNSVREKLRARSVELIEERLQFKSPAIAWRKLKSDLYRESRVGEEVLVDITTMPRETIWATLFWLEQFQARVHYAYHRPASYGTGWLARDPDEPRFVFKLAGSPRLDRQTALLAVTGYDSDRARQAINYFEPARVTLAVQVGTQFENQERNVGSDSIGAFDTQRVERLELDAFANDHGYAKLYKIAEGCADEFNVVMCSFGPKLSAIALYRVQRRLPHCALAYIHCRDYSEDYSTGIGDTLRGTLPVFTSGPI